MAGLVVLIHQKVEKEVHAKALKFSLTRMIFFKYYIQVAGNNKYELSSRGSHVWEKLL